MLSLSPESKTIMFKEFVGNLVCPPKPGHVFVISGVTKEFAQRLDIDFLTSSDDYETRIFHVSIRFDECIIINNTKLEKTWGTGERWDHGLQSGGKFRIYVLAMRDEFHISFDNAVHAVFKYKASLNDIKAIRVCKDIRYVTQFDHRMVYPTAYPYLQWYDDKNWIFSHNVPQKFIAGDVMILKGMTLENPKGSFTMCFYEGASKKHALTFTADFDKKIVVRDSMDDNMKITRVEQDGSFPFMMDKEFKLTIGFTKTHFVFAVDGKKFCTYKYSSPNQLELLCAFHMKAQNGLMLNVGEVKHKHCASEECDGIEKF